MAKNKSSKIKTGFTHLHVHSHYSLLDGLGKIDDLIRRTKELGMDTLALTDHGTMYGAVEFFNKAKEAGIKPIIGCEVYLAAGKMIDKQPRVDEERYHLVLLAENDLGYKNLIKIVTAGHLQGFYYKPRVDKEFLGKHSEGLIALSACLAGEIPRCIVSGDLIKAENKIKEYQSIFGANNFFLEMEYHQNSPDQALVNQKLVELSRKTGAKLVATCDVHYVWPEDKEVQDALVCIQQNKKVTDTNRLKMTEFDLYLKSPEEMRDHFPDLPEALENTVLIGQRCSFNPEMGKIILPYFEIPGGEDENDYLRKLCQKGVRERYGSKNQKAIAERLDFELSVIKKMGYSSYFLIVADFVNWAKSQKIVVGPGRGSAAGSIVSYLLKITDIDPIKYDLLFERFLNPDRISMPDIDVDFADDRRDEVIEYVSQKYGRDKVAQIITFGTMAARAAVRDAGRALDYPYDFCDKIAKEIPMMTKLAEALKKSVELKKMYDEDNNVRRVIDMAQKLEGVARHASTHACGIVITKDPLVDYAPLQRSVQGGKLSEDAVVTQYEGKSIEALGLLKMDFLGLKNLTILQNVIDIIRAKYQKEIILDKIPLDDKKTLSLFAKGETTGVFQFESSGFKRYLRELKPSRFQDLIDMVALYRPGPMDWIPDYISGKHGRREITYLHPKLKPILEKTYGIVVVQEQVMEIAKQLAGFTAGEADYLRKAMGKKIKKLMDEQRDKFILGCISQGIKGKTAEQIWDFIKPFAGYGFNWAHSACYAMIGYQTAYFKAYYPSEFMAALLGSDQDNTDRISVEVEECRKMGIRVAPPDVNEGYGRFASVEKNNEKVILYGLNAVKNVGKKVASAIVEERKKGGKYRDVLEFAERVAVKDLNKKSLESLAKSGALDAIGEREIILGNLDNILKYAKEARSVKERGQESLFGDSFDQANGSSQKSTPAPLFTERVTLSKRERLGFEKELLGAYLTENPMEEFANFLRNKVTPINQLKISPTPNVPQNNSFGFRRRNQGQAVKIGGLINKVKKIYTKNNQEMAFVELEDLTGKLEVVVFPGVFQKESTIWQEDKMVAVWGKLNDKDGALKVLADKAEEITPAMEKRASQSKKQEDKGSEEKESKEIETEAMEEAVSQRLLIQYDAQKGDASKIKELLSQLGGGSNKIIFEITQQDSVQKNQVKIAGEYRFSGTGFEALKNYLTEQGLAFKIVD